MYAILSFAYFDFMEFYCALCTFIRVFDLCILTFFIFTLYLILYMFILSNIIVQYYSLYFTRCNFFKRSSSFKNQYYNIFYHFVHHQYEYHEYIWTYVVMYDGA